MKSASKFYLSCGVRQSPAWVWLFLFMGISNAVAAANHAVPPLLIFGKPVEIIDGAMQFTGKIIHAGPADIAAAKGVVKLSAQTVRWPSARKPLYTFKLPRLAGELDYAKSRPAATRLVLSAGTFELGLFRWKTIVLKVIAGLVSYSHGTLIVKSCHGLWHHHPWQLAATYQTTSGTIHVRLTAARIDQQRLFQFFAPSRIDVTGPAKLTAEFSWKPHQHPVGSVTIESIGPGILKIKNIPVLTRRVVYAYGKRMAMLMMEDLREYPYIHERLTARENAQGLQIRYHFVRGTSNPQHLKPHMVSIDGQEVMFRPRDLKSYSNTITLPHTGIRKLYRLSREFTHPDAR